ncbi:hypothetical protein A2U01_0045190, partial [Trifolium medium]|nr:hypothetical protein [Trifolium medium]
DGNYVGGPANQLEDQVGVDVSSADVDSKGEAGVEAGLDAECAVRPSKKRANVDVFSGLMMRHYNKFRTSYH